MLAVLISAVLLLLVDLAWLFAWPFERLLRARAEAKASSRRRSPRPRPPRCRRSCSPSSRRASADSLAIFGSTTDPLTARARPPYPRSS